jgi:hypothetical protein
LFAQNQSVYTGTIVTGQLQRFTTTNISQIAAQSQASSAFLMADPERPGSRRRLPPPPTVAESLLGLHGPRRLPGQIDRTSSTSGETPVPNLSVISVPGIGFDGMTHSDQRLANSGNQFSVEPPNPSIAVANGSILEGVNNAVRVFSTSGAPLTATIASNQLFGLGPAIDRTRTPNVYGVFTADMRGVLRSGRQPLVCITTLAG